MWHPLWRGVSKCFNVIVCDPFNNLVKGSTNLSTRPETDPSQLVWLILQPPFLWRISNITHTRKLTHIFPFRCCLNGFGVADRTVFWCGLTEPSAAWEDKQRLGENNNNHDRNNSSRTAATCLVSISQVSEKCQGDNSERAPVDVSRQKIIRS